MLFISVLHANEALVNSRARVVVCASSGNHNNSSGTKKLLERWTATATNRHRNEDFGLKRFRPFPFAACPDRRHGWRFNLTNSDVRSFRTPPPTAANSPSRTPEIYVLELAGGKVYVGKSTDVGKRFLEHASGHGASFTRAYPPTGNFLPRLSRVPSIDGGDAAERDEMLRWASLRGIHATRGWRYTSVTLSADEARDIEMSIREMEGRCRRCGRMGHFRSSCREIYDRHGMICH